MCKTNRHEQCWLSRYFDTHGRWGAILFASRSDTCIPELKHGRVKPARRYVVLAPYAIREVPDTQWQNNFPRLNTEVAERESSQVTMSATDHYSKGK